MYRYTLDKSSKKHNCPKCKENRFVFYLDTTINKPLNECVGRCDKESTCGYHYTPKQYFHDYPQAKEQIQITAFVAPILSKEKVVFLFPFSYVERTQNRDEENYFISHLLNLFSFDKVQEAVNMYYIGTSIDKEKRVWNKAPIFWQIDDKQQVRTGKILPYYRGKFNRLKINGEPIIDFIHAKMKRKGIPILSENEKIDQCLFGLHLAPSQPHKTVAAVESEKTAVIMSLILPEYLWLSFGGLNNIFQLNTPILQGRKIVVFPDAGTYEKLQPKIIELQTLGFNISISNLIENKATEVEKEKGYDLADYAILNAWHNQVKTDFMDMVERNPLLNIFAYKFKCSFLDKNG
jgi:hypothetical protein